MLKHLDVSIDEAISEIESSEASESGEYRLPESLVDAASRRAEIEKSLRRLSQLDREHCHPGEPDARMVKSREGPGFGYNAQIVVDGASCLIVAEDVVNDESDNELLVDMVEEVKQNLGTAAEETVADGGYYSPNQLAEAEKRGMEVLVPVPSKASSQGLFHRSQFRYAESDDVYICPEGHSLSYEKTCWNSHKKYLVRVYRCGSYQTCPVRHQCCGGEGARRVLKGEHDDAVSRQRAKQRDGPNRELMRSQMAIVEPVFAHIKEHMGFRHWTARNLENVRTQWSLICTAFNLKKLYHYWLAGRLEWSR